METGIVTKVNFLMGTGTYSATSINMKLVHWPLMGGLLHLVQQGGTWAGCVPIRSPYFLLYNGSLLCVFE